MKKKISVKEAQKIVNSKKNTKKIVKGIFGKKISAAKVRKLSMSSFEIQVISIMHSYDVAATPSNIISSFARAGYYLKFRNNFFSIHFKREYAHPICDEFNWSKEDIPLPKGDVKIALQFD